MDDDLPKFRFIQDAIPVMVLLLKDCSECLQKPFVTQQLEILQTLLKYRKFDLAGCVECVAVFIHIALIIIFITIIVFIVELISWYAA